MHSRFGKECLYLTVWYINVLFLLYNSSIMLLGGRLSSTLCMDLLHGPFAWTFCMDLLHGPFAWTFCMDFLHGLFAWTFCMDFLHGH